MTIRTISLVLVMVVGLSACGGSRDSDARGAAAASGDDELSSAISAFVADCFDPLHDSDGSDGFFELCARAEQAKTAGQLDCFQPSFGRDDDSCDGWRVTRDDVPQYYFATDASPAEPGVIADEAPPAVEQPAESLDPVTGFPVDRKILEWNEFGGCDWGGFCVHFSVYGNGRVVATRSDGTVLDEGSVDSHLVRAVIDRADRDTNEVLESLAPGPCASAADGIDYELWIGPADLRIDSCTFDLSSSDPLIAAARELGEAAAQSVPIDRDALGE